MFENKSVVLCFSANPAVNERKVYTAKFCLLQKFDIISRKHIFLFVIYVISNSFYPLQNIIDVEQGS